jgi:hypothetical protein
MQVFSNRTDAVLIALEMDHPPPIVKASGLPLIPKQHLHSQAAARLR